MQTNELRNQNDFSRELVSGLANDDGNFMVEKE